MLYSLLIKLAMLVLTIGIVFWIGWTVPASRYVETDHVLESGDQEVHPMRSASPPTMSEVAPHVPIEPPPTGLSRQSIPRTLDLNAATERDLVGLPGIGPVLAQRIVHYREARGAFQDVEHLRRVKGIGKKTYERIRTLVGVRPSQTTAPAGKGA
jgi:competence protein ComEA